MIISPGDSSKSSLDNNFLCDKVCNILYSKDYTIFPINEYCNGVYSKSFIAVSNDSNDKLRRDSIYLIDEFNKDSIIVKYKDEELPKRILNNGSERLLGINAYDGDFNSRAYVYNNSAFCFVEQKRYKVLSDKTQLRKGMVVEFFNNEKWTERKVDNVDIEYERMYKLLIKYQKLRVCID
jgi:hypothetical protein